GVTIQETGMDELHVEVAAAIPPQRLTGIGPYVPILVVAQLREEIGDGRRRFERFSGQALRLLRHLGEPKLLSGRRGARGETQKRKSHAKCGERPEVK